MKIDTTGWTELDWRLWDGTEADERRIARAIRTGATPRCAAWAGKHPR